MPKKKSPVKKGEQIPLIDVGPQELKKIIPLAKNYKAAVKTRVTALEEEVAYKKQLLELVEAEGLSRDAKGKIRFKADGLEITVTPRDNLIQVKEKKDK
jgi:hypothetical protein